MMVRHRDRGGWRRARFGGVLVGCLALALSACASSGPSQQSESPTVRSTPTASPTGRPSLTASPLPTGSTAPGTITTLQGTLAQGVEAGCVVLTDDAGAVQANLFGLDQTATPLGTDVEVTGTFEPDMMTTCQQGTPFEVVSASRR